MLIWRSVIVFITIILSVLILALACKDSNPLDPVLYDYGVVIDTVLSSASVIIIENQFGAIHIEGSVSEDGIFMRQQKKVLAENSTVAESYYDKMSFIITRSGDSIFVSTEAPYETKNTKPSCNIGIQMLPAIRTIIKNSRNNITLYYLNSTSIVENAFSNITLVENNGSCDVRTTGGDINIETFIPTAGFCRAYSGSGNIALTIPVFSTARVDAMTKNGVVSVAENFIFTDVVESANTFKGTLKDGSGEVYLRAEVGNIDLKSFAE
jgi:DUF4097 and DUF4098 domain-containing protein YvlB